MLNLGPELRPNKNLGRNSVHREALSPFADDPFGIQLAQMTQKTRCWVIASNRLISLIKTETQAS